MAKSADYVMVFCSCPDLQTGTRIAQALVAERLAASVNILPQVHSVYRWRGEIAQAAEVMLLIKSRAGLFGAISQTILAHHPYELPEIVEVPVGAGLPEYLQWLDETVEQTQ